MGELDGGWRIFSSYLLTSFEGDSHLRFVELLRAARVVFQRNLLACADAAVDGHHIDGLAGAYGFHLCYAATFVAHEGSHEIGRRAQIS